MSKHQSAIRWHRAQHPIDHRTYSRNHVTALNGQQSVNVSSSIDFKGDPACADPEQMLVSALASCHMLTFLAIAELQGYRVDQYEDNAVGYLEKADGGGMAITRIELSPKVIFGGEKTPDAAALNRIHSRAHKNCFIGNSIKAKVTVAAEAVVG
jgi:organic hydroperoxide reductase OsmC/OhrA